MKHADTIQPTMPHPEEQLAPQPPSHMQEQIDFIASQLDPREQAVFLAASERFNLARVQVGEKAIGEMGNQIRESEESSEKLPEKAHNALNAWMNGKVSKLWRARDEAVSELLTEHVPYDDPKHAEVSAAEEVQNAADAFMDERVPDLKTSATRLLDTKIDERLPRQVTTEDEEAVAAIGIHDFDEVIQAKLDKLGAVIDGIKPKNIGRRVLRKVAGEATPTEWSTESDLFDALHDFERNVDQVRHRNGVNLQVRQAVADYLSDYGLLYPDEADYVTIIEEVVAESRPLFATEATKTELINYLENTTIAKLREMGYVDTEAPQAPEVVEPVVPDEVLIAEVNAEIERLRGEGNSDNRIKKMLLRQYRDATGGKDDPRAKFVSAAFIPQNASDHFQD